MLVPSLLGSDDVGKAVPSAMDDVNWIIIRDVEDADSDTGSSTGSSSGTSNS